MVRLERLGETRGNLEGWGYWGGWGRHGETKDWGRLGGTGSMELHRQPEVTRAEGEPCD